MIIDVVTLFPSMFSGVIGESILKRAQEQGQVKINLVNLRDYSKDKHKKVDAPPYGGGPGMVIMAEPVFDAVEDLRKNGREEAFLVLLTPGGVRYDQTLAQELSKQKGLIILCGHYKGSPGIGAPMLTSGRKISSARRERPIAMPIAMPAIAASAKPAPRRSSVSSA